MGQKEIIGYGDPECTRSCPTRELYPVLYQLMPYFTHRQIEAARAGDMAMTIFYEGLQNHIATQLGCKPGRLRI